MKRTITAYYFFTLLIAIQLFGQEPGTVKWKFNTQYSIVFSPAIDKENNIYISSRSKIYSLNSSGGLNWFYYIEGWAPYTPTIGIDNKIYISLGYFGVLDKTKIYSLNQNGTLNCNFTAEGYQNSLLAIDNDGSIYKGLEFRLCKFQPDSTELWCFETGGSIYSSPAISSNGSIYFGSWDNKVYALNSEGLKLWSFTTGGSIFSSPAIGSDGTIYIGSNDNKLYALNPDGTKKWSFQTEGWIFSSPVIGLDSTIYFGSWDYNLYALNKNGGKLWSFTTDSIIRSTPVVGKDGNIYFGSDDKKIYALDKDGNKKWSIETNDCVNSSPVLSSDGTLYIGSNDGNLYAIQTTSMGLADSPWPKFRGNAQNTGMVNTEFVSLEPSDEQIAIGIPENYQLHPNYPNPFNPTTTIRYDLPEASNVTLKVFDVLGREVTTLVDRNQEPGYHQIEWNASEQASGMYIVRMQAGDYGKNVKVILMK